jgi:hypothetical protein
MKRERVCEMSQFKNVMLDMEDELSEIIESTPSVGSFNGRNAFTISRRKAKIKEIFLKKYPNASAWLEEWYRYRENFY